MDHKDRESYMEKLARDCDSLIDCRNRESQKQLLLVVMSQIDQGYYDGFITRQQLNDYMCQLIDRFEILFRDIDVPENYPRYLEFANQSDERIIAKIVQKCWSEAETLTDQEIRLRFSLRVERNLFHSQSKLSKAYVCPVRQSLSKAIITNTQSECKKDEQEAKMVDIIMAEVADGMSQLVEWNDISGLDSVKKTIQEIVIWPMLRPDIFTGLRGPPKGLLLFGPPGTGKTLIGRCVACQSKSKFFSISASSLTSKWEGEGEKLVRTLFRLAREHSPSVIFMDEIDSLLTRRKEGESDAARRIKTEFLVQMDGVRSDCHGERILMIGATNRPQEIDDAARRRFTKAESQLMRTSTSARKRLYVPLPEKEGRFHMLKNALENLKPHSLTDSNIETIAEQTSGFSGADMASLFQEAAMNPIRRLTSCNVDIAQLRQDQVTPVSLQDFIAAFRTIKPSVGRGDLIAYEQWNSEFGTQCF